MLTDPIADMLTRIRNAQMAKKQEVEIPASKLKFGIAKILEREQFVGQVEEVKEGHGKIIIKLKYKNGVPAIKNIQRVSRPGLRVYVNSGKLPRILNDFGIAIISTSRGLMTNKDARKERVGGEVLCEVY